jgi:hypothetical protein
MKQKSKRKNDSMQYLQTRLENNHEGKQSLLTWNRRPSGEKVFTPRSYSDLVKYMIYCYKISF